MLGLTSEKKSTWKTLSIVRLIHAKMGPPPHPCVELRTDGNLHTPSTDAFSFNERWPGTVAKPVHFSQSQKSKAAK